MASRKNVGIKFNLTLKRKFVLDYYLFKTVTAYAFVIVVNLVFFSDKRTRSLLDALNWDWLEPIFKIFKLNTIKLTFACD